MPAMQKINYSPKNEVFSKKLSILPKSIPAIFLNLHCPVLLCVKATGTALSKGTGATPSCTRAGVLLAYKETEGNCSHGIAE